jgi:cytoskeleton protein RodZ
MTKVTRLTLGDDGSSGRRIHLREISDDADSPLETVGQDLRAARLRRGDDLASVSRVLKIRKDHLEALEEDRIDALPGRTYAVGFVRSYADYLGLDSAQCVERFKAEMAGQAEEITQVHVIEEDEVHALPQGWKIIAGIVVVLLLYGGWHLIASVRQTTSPPATPSAPQASSHTHKVAHAAKPPTKARIAAVEPGGAANITPPRPAGTPGQPRVGQSKPAAIAPAPGATGSAPSANTGPSQQQVAALPQGQLYGAQNKNPRVILRVHEPTKVLVLGPARKVYINRTLKPGDSYQVPNLVGLSLTTPNGGAVEIDLDGAAMGYAGRAQQMTEAFSLDPQAIADRYSGHGG